MEPPASLIPVALRHVSSCQLNSFCMVHASLLAQLHYMKTHVLDSTEFFCSNSKIILWLGTYIFIIGIFPYSFPPSIWDSGSCWKKKYWMSIRNNHKWSSYGASTCELSLLNLADTAAHFQGNFSPLNVFCAPADEKPFWVQIVEAFSMPNITNYIQNAPKKRGGWVGGGIKKN